jgi:hypothetical protein
MSLRIIEGIDEFGAPDEKYYAFDWDDNIVTMPTKIILIDEDGQEVGMSTEEFADYRDLIGKEIFDFDGHKIVGLADKPFRYFKDEGEKQFIIDAITAKPGPAWPDFVEAINNGSIFAIVTARGHNPSVIKEACYNYIVLNYEGIDSNELLRNLEKYRDLTDQSKLSKRGMIREYLDMCRFYPVTYGEGSALNPEEGKIKALDEFKDYVKKISKELQNKAYLKNKISNFFIPTIGFSDDDIKNVESVKKHFEKEPDNIIQTYSTKGGIKQKY